MNTKNFAIGILSVTAAILLVGLVLVNVAPRTAEAAGVGEAAGDYTMSVGRYNQDRDLLYLIHNPTQQLRVYQILNNQVIMADGIDLAAP